MFASPHTQWERGRIDVARTTLLPGKEEAPQTRIPLREESFSQNAKASPESPSQGSSVYPENNGPSLHGSPNQTLCWGMKCHAKGLRGLEVLKSGCIPLDFFWFESWWESCDMGWVWGYPVVSLCTVSVCAPSGLSGMLSTAGVQGEMPGKSLPLLRPFLSNKARPLELSAWRLSWYVEGYFNQQMFNFFFITQALCVHHCGALFPLSLWELAQMKNCLISVSPSRE